MPLLGFRDTNWKDKKVEKKKSAHVGEKFCSPASAETEVL